MDELKLAEIRGFLLQFKKIVAKKRGLDIVNRRENIEALAKLGLTKKNLREEIMTLSVENYCEGPEPDRDRPGFVWVFGKHIGSEEIYIKLKIAQVGKEKIAKCISFPCRKFSTVLPIPGGRKERWKMKGICPNCEKETELELIQRVEEIKVRGEPIKVEVKYYKCKNCGEEFEDPHSDEDPLDKAYREYRRRHGMMQPEEVRDFRKKFGLTQNEMSRLLGWGGATLSRYENGALQDETHEKALRLAMDPRNLLKLIEGAPDTLSEEKRNRLTSELQAAEEEACSLERIYEERFGKYEANELSGYRRLDLAKLFNAILYFCKGGVLKTKLNKLLFYADFKHFKDYAVSITGAQYAHVPFGPAPDKYALYFATLLENGAIDVKEYVYSEEVTGEEFISAKEPDLSLFSDSELKILATVKENFKDFSVKKITDFSHDEKAYKETATGDIISYEYANELKL